jgi:hypothetical protein
MSKLIHYQTMSNNDDAAVRRFVQETGAPEAVARNALAIQNGNYVRAKQAYMNRTTTSSAAGNGVATLSSLQGGAGVSAKKRNELFAGGASSGIAQLGPAQDSDDEADHRGSGGTGGARRHGDVNELVAGVMDSARRQGAVDHSSMPVDADADSFTGQGRRLGDGGVSAAVPAKTKPNQVVISFYKNGFTTAVLPAGANVHATDLGPLRRYDDPAQATFLESINQGRVPEEFRSLTKDGVVLDVSLVDKKSEDWSAPKGAAAAFTGHGQALGSSSASSTSSTATTKQDCLLLRPLLRRAHSSWTSRSQRRRCACVCSTANRLWSSAIKLIRLHKFAHTSTPRWRQLRATFLCARALDRQSAT